MQLVKLIKKKSAHLCFLSRLVSLVSLVSLAISARLLLASEEVEHEKTYRKSIEVIPSKEDLTLGADLSEIAEGINEIKTQIDKFQSDVIQAAKIRNFVSIQLLNSLGPSYGIRAVEVKLAGKKLFHSDSIAVAKANNTMIPLFLGPLIPGEHMLEVVTVLFSKEDPIFSWESNHDKKISFSQSLRVPEVEAKLDYQVKIIGDQEGKGTAKMILEQKNTQ